ncbi:helix-turn-helix domain-containing protein [Streptomyces sp. CA-288835]|uniref:AraC-like ligand-binding domain-containing protein n=1 Tax=Streptomyces sp. CA-288835 TaxID=3240069 RepID=UPI003D8D2CF6
MSSTAGTEQSGSLAAELWREQLGGAFGRLVPEAIGARAAHGRMAGTQLGTIAAYRVSGTPQIVRRTPRAVRQTPIDLLKICVQLSGYATVCQDDREISIAPGQMAIYDTGRPYHLRLERQWSCAVMAFPRGALSLPEHMVVMSMSHAYPLADGPGAVLAGFVSSAVSQRDAIPRTSADRLGEAGLHLVAAALSDAAPCGDDGAADALRLQILTYIRAHLAEPDLTHARVAAAHHMSARTLHRLFEHESCTVTDYIRSRRLEAARRDLADPLLAHRSIAAIAAHWCFVGQAHFTRAFHAKYGMNPSAVRRGAPATPSAMR